MRGNGADQPHFEQPNWRAETVINAGQVNFSKTAPEAPEAPDRPPPASTDPGFRRNLARLLLRKLPDTLDEAQWLDKEFVDLSVAVEDIDGRPVPGRRLSLFRRRRTSIRPLSQVLSHSQNELILLQGGAGAGKSVALLLHARSQLRQIADGRGTPEAPLPLYVNLRELRAQPEEMTTAVLQQYIREQTGPRGNADVAAYFTHCFQDDLRNGRVTLLLDSFDEIPAVYGSATIDTAVSPYVETIVELVGGGGHCVVASREYKGPRRHGWTRLQLMPLSGEQQEAFLKRLRLGEWHLSLVRPLLTDPRRGFATVLGNPLHLRLLATYVEGRNSVPERPSELFAEFAAERLRDALPTTEGDDPESASRVRRAVQDFLAHFAYSLTAGRGLSMDEQTYQEEISRQTADTPEIHDLMVSTLSRARILRTAVVESTGTESVRRVFFGHRRVLEYFASRYAVEHPSLVSCRDLATNGRWRETAVAVLQDGTADSTTPLLAAVAEVLVAERQHAVRAEGTGFVWSPEAVHCLELLTTAYQGHPDRPHELVRPLVEELVALAWEQGSVSDRKFALDCLPLLSETARQIYMDLAFSGDSDWLRRTALRDCATLAVLSPSVQASIRRLLITRLAEPMSTQESHALNVDLQRLHQDDDLMALRRVIDRTPRRVGWMALVSASMAFVAFSDSRPWLLLGLPVTLAALPTVVFWIFQSSAPLSYGSGRNLPHRVLFGLEDLSSALETMTVLRSLFRWALYGAAFALMIPISKSLGWLTAGWSTVFMESGALLLASHSILWGPSLLYAVHLGRSAHQLRGIGLVLAVPYALKRYAKSPRRRWFGLSWNSVLGGMLFTAVIWAVMYGGYLLLRALAPALLAFLSTAWFVLSIVGTALGAAMVLKPAFLSLCREIPRRRRLDRAFQSGSSGGPVFFSALFELREAGEAADYVRRVRNVPRGEPLRLDRRTLRQCIALLQGRPADEPAVPIPPNGIRCLIRWQGSTELLDELGRLDEQLRTR